MADPRRRDLLVAACVAFVLAAATALLALLR